MTVATPCWIRTWTGWSRCGRSWIRPVWLAPILPAVRSADRSRRRWRRFGQQTVKKLVLIAPFGLFDEKDPPTDPWGANVPTRFQG